MAEATRSGGKTFHLRLISPERVLLDGEARAIQAHAVDGMIGVLCGHAPLVTPLVPGTLRVQDGSGETRSFAVGEGFLEVFDDQVRVMVDSAERPDEIDPARAERARQRAQERLTRRGLKDVDYARAEAALRRALARLKVAGRI